MFGVWQILRFFFDFIAEVILGKNKLKDVYRYDRRRIYVLAIVMISIIINVLTVPRLIELSYEHYLLKTQVESMECHRVSPDNSDRFLSD